MLSVQATTTDNVSSSISSILVTATGQLTEADGGGTEDTGIVSHSSTVAKVPVRSNPTVS